MYRCVKTLLVVCLFASLIAGQSWASDYNQNRPQSGDGRITEAAFVPGRVLVKYRDGDAASTHQFMMAAGARLSRTLPKLGAHVIDLPADADEEKVLMMLRARPDVEFAELDYILYPQGVTPDDPLYASQWHLPRVSCPDAWATTPGSEQITIAICDTGVDATHPDLAPKIVPGWNVVNNNSDTSPVSSHGTWTAGTAAAIGNNSIGVASPALNCRIMPIRVSSVSSGSAQVSDLAEAIVWAADNGARVASVSYMAGANPMILEAGDYMQSKGGVLVCASGNSGAFSTTPDSPDAIVVGATNQADAVAPFSTTGFYVDLAAPGVGIMTTAPNNSYQLVSGTSFSTPLVAGAAALMLSVNPDLTPAQVDSFLKLAADDLNQDGWDPAYGWGRLNVERAVRLARSMLDGSEDTMPPAVKLLQPQRGWLLDGVVGISSGEMIQVEAIDDTRVAEVTLIAGGQAVGSDTAAPFVFSWDTSHLADGSEHTLTVMARDARGNTTTVSTIARMRAGFDATPPEAAITSPRNGARVSGNARITVSAADNLSLARVELYIDNQLVAESTTAPFTLRWRANRVARGAHTLVAVAYDQAGNSSSSSVVTVIRR